MSLGTLAAIVGLLLDIVFYAVGKIDGAVALLVALAFIAILLGAVALPIGRRAVP